MSDPSTPMNCDCIPFHPEVDNLPKQIVLQFNVEYELEKVAIIERFFAAFGPEPVEDYYSHLMATNNSSKMHIVLDLRCKTNPVIHVDAIAHKVYKVKKKGELYIVPLVGVPELSTH